MSVLQWIGIESEDELKRILRKYDKADATYLSLIRASLWVWDR
ncbi:hypothetical protein LCGC14_1858000, partial [marine sediment metagenome]